jgi:ElaB/YqjD/DUF883 family membrane-anchored ribosome-binding protein
MSENGGGGTAGEARDRAREVAHGVQDRLDEVRGYAGDAGEWVRELARERPMTAIALAVGVGFVIGRLLSRT